MIQDSQDSQWLVEARRIRAKQDQAYAESLAIDQAKVYSCNISVMIIFAWFNLS